MTKLSKGLTYLVTLTLLFIIVSTVLFYFGMNQLENRPVSMLEAFHFVTQTMTTVGYGEFAPWTSPIMHILVIVTQYAGIIIVFMSVPIVVTPWIQERLALQAPSEYKGPGNHIVITEYTHLMDSLLDELEERNIPHVLIDNRREQTDELLRDDRNVMTGDPSEPETLEKAKLEESRLAILDGPDERKAMVALAIDEFDSELKIIAVAQETNRGTHLSQAGADEVIYPRELIGRVLGNHALRAVGKEFDIKSDKLSDYLDIREFPVLSSSSLHRNSLQSTALRSQFGVNVVGVWRRGKFINNPPGEFIFQKSDILVATGDSDQLDELEEYTEGSTASGHWSDRNIVIIGYGNEGEAARERLNEADIEPTILNDIDKDHVDVVGDGMVSETLSEAGVEDADTVIICISRDEVTVMVTLMVRRLNPRAEILAQVNQEFAIEPIYRAGANYVESLTVVVSRMLAGEALGEDLLSPELNIKLRHCSVGSLQGTTLKNSNIAQEYDISIIALERDDEIVTDLSPDLTFRKDDKIYVCGTDENVNRFAKDFQIPTERSE